MNSLVALIHVYALTFANRWEAAYSTFLLNYVKTYNNSIAKSSVNEIKRYKLSIVKSPVNHEKVKASKSVCVGNFGHFNNFVPSARGS